MSASSSSSSGRSSISLQNKYDRVILLVDMDCFYCQVEEKLDPLLRGQPLAVVQYNAWRGGGIIAVNYAARAKGVTRHTRGEEAKELCPEIQLAKVPNVRGKADLSKYRDAGKEVASVLQRFTTLLERASVDEAYLDITQAVNTRLEQMNAGTFLLQAPELVNTFAVGHAHFGEYVTAITSRFANPSASNDEADFASCPHESSEAVRQSDIRLLLGASIASEVRAAVKAETSYECSAGIAHNKILAKLACGMNKPNKQTLLPIAQIPPLFATLPVRKITGLGGKYGEEVCERLGVQFLGELLKFSEAELQRKFDEKNGSWLYNICRGIDLEVVTPRFYSKSIGCCKNFPGRNSISGLKMLTHWLNELAEEICERMAKDQAENNRRAKQMVVSYVQEFDSLTKDISSSRSAPLGSYDRETLAQQSLDVIKANTKQFLCTGSEAKLNNPIKFLGISVSKFETISSGKNTLQAMFAQQEARRQQQNNNESTESGEAERTETNKGEESVRAMAARDTIKSYFQQSQEEISAQSDTEHKIGEQTEKEGWSAENQSAENKVQENVAKKKTIKSFFVNYLQNKKQMTTVQQIGELQGRENELRTDEENNDKGLQNETDEEKDFKTKESFRECSDIHKINEKSDDDKSNESKCEYEESQQSTAPHVKSFFLNALKKQREDATTKLTDMIEYNCENANDESNGFFVDALRKAKAYENKQNATKNRDNEDMSTVPNTEDETDFTEAEITSPSQNTLKSQDCNLSNLEADLRILENEDILERENLENPKNAKTKEHRSFFATLLKRDAPTEAPEEATHNDNPVKKRKFSEIATIVALTDEATTSTKTTNYQVNYAEYAIPEINANFQFDLIKCDVCDAKIPAGDERALQTHRDHHYAQQLSQQQRIEYRAELKTKISGTSPVQKKTKKLSTNGGTKSVITNFLKPAATLIETPSQIVASINEPSTSHQALTTDSSVDEMEACAECKQLVRKTEMPQHKDYHLAKELQRKLNRLEVRTVAIVKKSNSSSGSSSATNKSLKSSVQLNVTHRSGSAVSKPITQYFSQPQF